jgi:hypothetical protein
MWKSLRQSVISQRTSEAVALECHHWLCMLIITYLHVLNWIVGKGHPFRFFSRAALTIHLLAVAVPARLLLDRGRVRRSPNTSAREDG